MNFLRHGGRLVHRLVRHVQRHRVSFLRETMFSANSCQKNRRIRRERGHFPKLQQSHQVMLFPGGKRIIVRFTLVSKFYEHSGKAAEAARDRRNKKIRDTAPEIALVLVSLDSRLP